MNGVPAKSGLGTAMAEVVRENLVRDPVLVCAGPGCERVIVRRPGAEHKRFCTDACRNGFHQRRRKAALQALAKVEAAQASGGNSPFAQSTKEGD